MAKKQSIKSEDIVIGEHSKTPEMRPSYSVYKDHALNRWVVVRVMYDSANMASSAPEVIFTEEARDMAVERFKVEVARNLLS